MSKFECIAVVEDMARLHEVFELWIDWDIDILSQLGEDTFLIETTEEAYHECLHRSAPHLSSHDPLFSSFGKNRPVMLA